MRNEDGPSKSVSKQGQGNKKDQNEKLKTPPVLQITTINNTHYVKNCTINRKHTLTWQFHHTIRVQHGVQRFRADVCTVCMPKKKEGEEIK